MQNDDTLHQRIKAFFFQFSDGNLVKEREMNDAVLEGETSIWFWTKFCWFSDIDNDGLVEPIIVYGTKNESDSSPYRIKIFVYYKGSKYAIRHTEGDLDFMRSTQIDENFHKLPQAIQNQVQEIIKMLLKNKLALAF